MRYPMEAKNPLMIDVTRGAMVESCHRGHAVVVDGNGHVLHAWGDVEKVVYPRSAIKPLQALALVETGAADVFGLSDKELALAAASHGATPEHTDLAARWLERIGLGPEALECGGHEPMDEAAANEMIRKGVSPGPIHNNCSGKHIGFLTTARHLGEPVAGYTGPDHPVQQRMVSILAEMGGCDLSQAPTGTDGCGIPVYGMPLLAMATAFARMAAPGGLPPERQAATKRIIAAMTAHPRLVAGPGRFDTIVMEAVGTLVVKTGAEGMYGGILPGLDMGIALKIEDGAKRAAEVAMAAILKFLGVIDDPAEKVLAAYFDASVTNAKGVAVGSIRMADGW